MRLKSLKIYNGINDSIIREMEFNPKGLSLIVDDTNSEVSGSNIGKSTAVKVIDVCLGAKSPSYIYSDKDTGNNIEIDLFINQNKVYAVLCCEIDGVEYNFQRSLHKNGKQSINGEIIKKINDYRQKLNEIIFKNSNNAITFRSLMPKFVRLETSSETLLKFLGNHTNYYTYRVLYNYLFGIDKNGAQNLKIKRDNEQIEKVISAFLNKNEVQSIESLELKKSLAESKLLELEKSLHLTDATEDYDKIMINIEEIAIQIENLELEKSKYVLRQNLFIEKIEREESNISEIDIELLRKLYEETKINVDNSICEFSELIEFHNSMIGFRVEALKSTLQIISEKIEFVESKLLELKKMYESKYIKYKIFVNKNFESKYSEYVQEKNRLASLMSDCEYVQSQKNIMEKNLKNFDYTESENKNKVIDEFNKHFNRLSNSILGESFGITIDPKETNFPLSIVGLKGNPGTGTKKALITCFDIAHINLVLQSNYNMPLFIIHDKMENIDLSELRKIIEESRNFEGQYIFPVLKDRVIDLDIKQEEIVLTLSKEDKLFRIK